MGKTKTKENEGIGTITATGAGKSVTLTPKEFDQAAEATSEEIVAALEEAPKGLRTEDIVPPADIEKKKAPRKKLTLKERKTLYETRLEALEKEEKARKKAQADREARKKSRELLSRVKEAWPEVAAWDQESFTERIELAAATWGGDSRAGGGGDRRIPTIATRLTKGEGKSRKHNPSPLPGGAVPDLPAKVLAVQR